MRDDSPERRKFDQIIDEQKLELSRTKEDDFFRRLCYVKWRIEHQRGEENLGGREYALQ